ncbi:PREDICTED: uncharacterized protein LOC109172686 [Ipomoea nil]|uniref:uncharacterized protein LOC109172686 n=1 Tax=Ipomoea nil TaxID=35883 RepID=UPI00090151DC|nr:PREDICTED: uncharacterized protein LOC109172686 [Ipomoea nil]
MQNYILKYKAHINVEWCNQSRSIKYLFKYVNKGNDRVTVEFYKTTTDDAVVFQDDDTINHVLNRETVGQSMFNAWFVANKKFKETSLLTYIEMPTNFVWKKDIREWHPRKKGFSIGRIFYVPPASDDDKEYIDVINEASYWSTAHSLRKLFVLLLTSTSIIRPENVWNQYVGIVTDLVLTEEEKKNFGLFELEKLLRLQNKSLKDYPPMPIPTIDNSRLVQNHLVFEELCYNHEQLKEDAEVLSSKLTKEQSFIYDIVIQDISANKGGLFFVYGYGGTGKIFLWRALSAAVRCKGQIVLNVASSGIASLLLPGGRTAHSRFAISIAINEESTCNIKQGSDLAELLIKTSLIIWDEAPMMHKHCFESLDRTMRDLLRFVDTHSSTKTFGGKTVVLGGDFCQILPVVPKGTRQDIVSSAINSSYLWDSYKVLRLTKNLTLSSVPNGGNRQALQEFADWIATIDDGKMGGRNDGYAEVEIPKHMLLPS